jgi:hypothetical protein
MANFNADLARRNDPVLGKFLPLVMRWGVNSGRMFVGDAGPDDASDYTPMGEPVNIAARLESANKWMGTRILMSESTALLLPAGRFLIRLAGRLRLVGCGHPVMTYEPLALADEADDALRATAELSNRMVGCFLTGDFEGCLNAEERLTGVCGPTRFAEVYRQSCDQYLSTRTKRGPSAEIVLPFK